MCVPPCPHSRRVHQSTDCAWPQDSPWSRRHLTGTEIKPHTRTYFLWGPSRGGGPRWQPAGPECRNTARRQEIPPSLPALLQICSVTLNWAPSLPVLGRGKKNGRREEAASLKGITDGGGWGRDTLFPCHMLYDAWYVSLPGTGWSQQNAGELRWQNVQSDFSNINWGNQRESSGGGMGFHFQAVVGW